MRRWVGHNGQNAHLKLHPRTVHPACVFGEAVDVGKGLDALLALARVVQNSTGPVHVVHNRGEVEICGGVPENSIIPSLEVWVAVNKAGQRIPLVLRSKKTRTILPDVCWARVGKGRWVFGPCCLGGRLRGLGEGSGVGLQDE